MFRTEILKFPFFNYFYQLCNIHKIKSLILILCFGNDLNCRYRHIKLSILGFGRLSIDPKLKSRAIEIKHRFISLFTIIYRFIKFDNSPLRAIKSNNVHSLSVDLSEDDIQVSHNCNDIRQKVTFSQLFYRCHMNKGWGFDSAPAIIKRSDSVFVYFRNVGLGIIYLVQASLL